MAALFSPPVLRYAVPALALAAVIGLSLLALRQQRSTEFIAQHQPVNPTTSDVEPNQSPAAAFDGKQQTPATLPQGANPTPDAGSSKEGGISRDDRGNLALSPGDTAGTNAPASTAPKDSGQPEQPSRGESKPVFAPEPQAAPPPRPALSESSKLRIDKEELAEREAQQRQRDEYRVQTTDEAEGNRSATAKAAASPDSTRRAQGLMADGKGSGARNKRDSAGEDETHETRKVSGKQFRRQGNAWVDTAYDPSRATINVTRGSEQFRALVADEPGIRTIAERLGGEVVLVWKGRAYRIR